MTFCAWLEYVLSTLDKIVNWARQGSMWPMTFGEYFSWCVPFYLKVCVRFGLLCGGDDAYGYREI